MIENIYTTIVDLIRGLDETIFFTIVCILGVVTLLCMVGFLKANKLENSSSIKNFGLIVCFIIFLALIIFLISLRY